MPPTTSPAPTDQPAIDLEADLLAALHRARNLPPSVERDQLIAELQGTLDKLREIVAPAPPEAVIAAMQRPRRPSCHHGTPSPSCSGNGCGAGRCKRDGLSRRHGYPRPKVAKLVKHAISTRIVS